MSTSRRLGCVLLLVVAAAPPAVARTAAVATEHPLAAEAGATVLRAGGSAVDAAIATAAAVCVVHASSCGIGGGGFALVRTADGTVAALDYREVAPAGATPDRFLQDGKPDPSRTVRGRAGSGRARRGGRDGRRCTRKFGKLPLGTRARPRDRLAREGFALSHASHLREQIAAHAHPARRPIPGCAAVFLDASGERAAGGRPHRPGRPRRRRSNASAERGAMAFYWPRRRPIAAVVQSRGGVLTADDVRSYRPRWRDPLDGTYRERRIVTLPPPGSGGVVLEILGILAARRSRGTRRRRRAPASRSPAPWRRASPTAPRWYGDADVHRVPMRLLDAGPPPRVAG